MKARSKELLDRAIAATVASIEIYNKPDFLYREEAFAVLAINGWELLLKAKWLADSGNKLRSLYVMEPRKKADGTRSKKLQVKTTSSGNPFTHSLDFLVKRLVTTGALDTVAQANNPEEKRFLSFIDGLETHEEPNSPFAVTVNIDIKFTRSKAKDALGVRVTGNPSAPEVRLTEEQIRDRYPWDTKDLTKECKKRYVDFKVTQAYHDIRKTLLADKKFGEVRFLDPGNPKSAKKPFLVPTSLSKLTACLNAFPTCAAAGRLFLRT